MSDQADFIFHGGNIITMDEKNPSADALAVKGDKIQAVGKLDEVFDLAGPSTRVIYLDQQTLLPGFIEPHQHAIFMVMQRVNFVNISGYYYRTYGEIKKKITNEIARLELDPGAFPLPWAVFFGWDPELVADLPTLSADFLDGFSTTFPIFIWGQSGHVAWVNHKAFEVAGVDDSIKNENGGEFVRDENGHLNGQLLEEPATTRIFRYMKRGPSDGELERAVEEQWRDYGARGLTTVTDLAYGRKERFDKLLETISLKDSCPIRLALYRFVHGAVQDEDGKATFTPNDKLWEAGVKIIADGSPHCGSAAVREPYMDTDLTQTLAFPPAPCYGKLNYTSEEMLEIVRFFHKEGTQIAVHAHGERAIDQVISAYEQVLNEEPVHTDMRHRLEHLGLCTEPDISRAAKLNLALSFFVSHLYFYGKSYTEHIFGAERTNRWTPLSEATKHGLRWSIHQDHPCFPGPPLPFGNIKTAVTRTQRDDKDTVYGPEYRASIHDAMKAVTIDAAWQIHRDDLGSLTPNKKADLLIVSKNPYEVDPFELEDIEVLETFLNGRPNGFSQTYPMELPEGRSMVYIAESKVTREIGVGEELHSLCTKAKTN